MKPIIHIDSVTLRQIQWAVNNHDFEVSGMGRIAVEGDIIKILSASVLEQVGSGTTTDIPAAALAKLKYDQRGEAGSLRFHWHSHVNMDTFWSGTDHKLIRDFAHEEQWCVAGVFNKKGAMRFCVAGVSPIPFFVDDVPLNIVDPPELVEVWRKDCAEKITRFTAPLPSAWPAKHEVKHSKRERKLLEIVDKVDQGVPLAWWEEEFCEKQLGKTEWERLYYGGV